MTTSDSSLTRLHEKLNYAIADCEVWLVSKQYAVPASVPLPHGALWFKRHGGAWGLYWEPVAGAEPVPLLKTPRETRLAAVGVLDELHEALLIAYDETEVRLEAATLNAKAILEKWKTEDAEVDDSDGGDNLLVRFLPGGRA